jgi:SAM-dependent methyltransferase
MKLHWAAPERNKQPILEILSRVLPERGTLLELGSGSGQHAEYFARALPGWVWLPSDTDPQHLASIEAYREDAGLPNLRPARALDVRAAVWHTSPLDAVFSANMIHVAPWECSVGLIQGAARSLRSGGQLIVYGPMRIGGQHTADSNLRFDAELRQRDPAWGVRDLEALQQLGEPLGLTLKDCHGMPAQNHCLVFERA